MNKIKLILIGAMFTVTANATMADQTGLLGLYQNGTSLNDTAVAALGCRVAREGFIVAAQGKLSPEIAEKFRQDNADLLVEVGIFNDAHLTAFTYLVGAATR